MRKMMYVVEADFRPYKRWFIESESESEARLVVCKMIGVPYDQTEARLSR